MTATASLQVTIYDCHPTGFVFQQSSISVEYQTAAQILTWTQTALNASCGTYSVASDSTPLVQVNGNSLTVLSSPVGTSTVTLTLSRDSNTTMQITAQLQVTIYDCHPIGFSLSVSTAILELQSLDQQLTWSQTALNSLCGTYSVTSDLPSTVSVSGQNITVLTSTAVNQTVYLTLTRDSNTSMTATASLAVKVYDCRPKGFALSVSSISLELQSPSGSLTWTMTAVDTLCGTYSVTSDQPLKVQPALLQSLVVETQTAEIYSTTLTLKRNNNSSMTATASLQVTIYDCHPTGFVFQQSSISVEYQTAAKTLTWTSDAKNPLCGTYSAISNDSTLVQVNGSDLIVQTTVAVQKTVTLTLQRDTNTAMTAATTLLVNIYDCTPTRFGLSSSSVDIALMDPANTVTWTMNTVDILCGVYSVTSDNPTLIQASGQTIFIQSNLEGLFSPILTLTRDAKQTMKTTTTLQVNVYDCRIKVFTLTPSTIMVEFRGPSEIVTWSYDAKDPLCGSYGIASTQQLQPMITINSQQTLAVGSTLVSQLPQQTLTIILQRLANPLQTALATLVVNIFCPIPQLVITQLAELTEVKVGLDAQPFRIPFEVDLPCYQPATFSVANSPTFLQIDPLTIQSGNLKVVNAIGDMHGVYKLKFTATAVAATVQTQVKDFTIVINGCPTSTFYHQSIPNIEVFKQNGLSQGDFRFNEFQHTFGNLGRACGKTVNKLKLAKSQSAPGWISLDQDNRLIKYDLAQVQKAGVFAYELQANLEEYPTVNITETFNITVASSEIICNQLPAASYHIKDTKTTFATSYSNQTFAAQTKLTKVILPVFKKDGIEVPQPSFVKYSDEKFSVYTESLNDVGNYELGLRIGYQEFPSFQVLCEQPLQVQYEPKFSGDAVGDRVVSCDQPWSLTLPEYIDSEKKPALVSIDLGQADQMFNFDQVTKRIQSDPEQLSSVTKTFQVAMKLTDSHDQSKTFFFNLIVSCQKFQPPPPPASKTQHNSIVLERPRPQISQITSVGLIRVKFSRQIVLPTYEIYPELKRSASCNATCGRNLNVTSEEEQAIDIVNTAQIVRNKTMMPIFDVELVPGMYSNITNLNFTWACVKFTPSFMDLQLNFTHSDLVSIYQERDSIKLRYNGYEYFKSEDGQTFPSDQILSRSITPQMDNQFASTLNFVTNSVLNPSRAILIFKFLLKLVLSQSLQQMFGAIIKLQILIHLPLLDIAVSPNAKNFCASLISLVNFEIYDLGPQTSRLLALKNDEPFNDSFEEFGYKSKYFVVNLGNLFYVFIVFLAGLLLLKCLQSAKHQRLVDLREKLRKSLVWSFLIDYLNQAILPIALSGFIAFWMWSFKNFGDAFDKICASIALLTVCFAAPIFKLVFLQRKQSELHAHDIREKFQCLYEKLRHQRTRWALIEPFLSDLRRMILVITIICLQGYPTFQLMSVYFSILAVTIYNGQVEPFVDRTTQRLEQFNELTISGVFYHLLCFADLVKDHKTRINIGWSMTGTTLFCLTVNFTVVLFEAVRKMIKDAKLYLLRRKLAKYHKRQQEIEEERKKQLLAQTSDQMNKPVEQQVQVVESKMRTRRRELIDQPPVEEQQQEKQENLKRPRLLHQSLEDLEEVKSNRKQLVQATFRMPQVSNRHQGYRDLCHLTGAEIQKYLHIKPETPELLATQVSYKQRNQLVSQTSTLTNFKIDVVEYQQNPMQQKIAYLDNPIQPRRNDWNIEGADIAEIKDFLQMDL